MARPNQSVTDASASTDTTTYTRVAIIPPDDEPKEMGSGHNTMRVCASANASSGTATVRLVLKDSARVYRAYILTLTPSAVRTAPAGSSGDYVCDVTGGVAGGEWVDLYGATSSLESNPLEWYIGVSAFSTVSSVTMDLFFARS